MSDLLIIGDSHGAALYQAAQARGLQADILYISGNHWHENRMTAEGRLGLSAAWRPGLQQRVREFARSQGGHVFPEHVPVLVSAGYHLGRIAPMLARHGHSATPGAPGLFLSDSFLQAWLQHHRGALWRILRLAARRADLMVVAPPVVDRCPTTTRLAAMITARLRKGGVRVYDPREEGDWLAEPLPVALQAPDGVHGTAAYGEEILARLQRGGWLALQKGGIAAQ